MESLHKQWRRFVDETQKSQEVVGELSKLSIILHENMRQTILKSTVDLKYNPSEDCQKHLSTILNLLKRLNDPNDSYLANVSSTIISKFEEQLHDLSDQVQKLLKSHTFAKGIDVKQLQGVKTVNEKQEFGLKDELKKSEQRRLRSRSGKRSSRPETSESSLTGRMIEQFAQYKKNFLSKREKLIKQMQGHVEKKDHQVIFSNKYKGTNLQDYFKKRSQLLDLQLVDQYTQKMMLEQQKPVQKKQEYRKEDFQNNLFSQFKIKTKYMKKQVKENILNALVDVKIKLLEEYHSSNIKRLKEGNPDTLVALVTHRHNRSQTTTQHKDKKHAASASTFQSPGYASSLPSKQPQRQISLTRYPMAMKSCRPMVYGRGWSDSMEGEFRKTMGERLLEGRVPN